ncbi:uncharacterized protein A4U43_C04F6810 [Asparagus officinalis]|uniref:DUF4283 domain-containing protein n=1 Tax=Asparagus officinalis TaxID=4686 RepID=A0A5P1EYU8_ASPOF|nr:uncharacterized protein A4U43_C04F6810 [Asparagus officinalis]
MPSYKKNFNYKIYKWHNLCHVKENACRAPVWVAMPKQPLQCFIPEFLKTVANKIGCFLLGCALKLISGKRFHLTYGLGYMMMGSVKPLIYENLPKDCNGCHVEGHSIRECRNKCMNGSPSLANEQSPALFVRTQGVQNNASPSKNRNSLCSKKSLQSNVEANEAFWEAVNLQVAQIEKAKADYTHEKSNPTNNNHDDSSESDPIYIPSSSSSNNKALTQDSSEFVESSDYGVESSNPFSPLQDAQDPNEESNSVTLGTCDYDGNEDERELINLGSH